MQTQEGLARQRHGLFSNLRRPGSLSRRLALENVFILFLVLLIIGGAVFLLVSYFLTADIDQRLQAEGGRLQSDVATWEAHGRTTGQAFLTYLVSQNQADEFASPSIAIKLLNPHTGALLKRSANLETTHLPLNQADFHAALQGRPGFNTYQNTRGEQVRVLTLPLRNAAHQTILIAQASISLASTLQMQKWLAAFLVGGSIVSALIAYAIALLFVRRSLQPLTLLGRTMDRVATQGLHVRATPQQHTREVEMLSTAFNHMLRQLETNFVSQEDFVADISHELRTPLTAIRGQIDVLLLNPEHSERTRQDLRSVQAEIGRLSRLVANLLTHARAEIGILPQVDAAQRQMVEIDDLLLEILHQLHFLKPQVNVVFQEFQPCEVPGNRDLLKQLFFNLLDNAITYTPPDGCITLDLRYTKNGPFASFKDKPASNALWTKISVRNTGQGISQADLPHLFERNYRASRPDVPLGRQHSGLGLPIALMIAQSHGGIITIESVPNAETCFTVWLPLTDQPAELAGSHPTYLSHRAEKLVDEEQESEEEQSSGRKL